MKACGVGAAPENCRSRALTSGLLDSHGQRPPLPRGNLNQVRTDQLESPGRCIRLATFHASEKTHLAVLPQRRALESTGADNPGRDETSGGLLAPTPGPGMRHERGETVGGDAPFAGGVTRGSGAGREAQPWVFVLDKDGAPLDPCHPARARKLLSGGRAVVTRRIPFVIRLKDRGCDESEVQGVEVGIDPGSERTGMSMFTVTGEGIRAGKFSIRLDHRSSLIRRRLQSRAAYRRARRSRSVRYRAPRYRNRLKPDGWLAPSLRHRVDTTVNWVHRLRSWAPLKAVRLETASFDVRSMREGRALGGAERRQGDLAGYGVREYLLERWRRSCAYCGVQAVPLQVEHIRPKARGGSDRVCNLVVACRRCNLSKGAQPVESFLAGEPALLQEILGQLEPPLRHASAMNATRRVLAKRLLSSGVPVTAASGEQTRSNRSKTGAVKSHTLDALHVGRLNGVASWPTSILVVTASGRGAYARTTPDKYGFPRLVRTRRKVQFGFCTGDLVQAQVPRGRHAGTHVGRVSVRSTGRFALTTRAGRFDIRHGYLRLLQRADGYSYAFSKETSVES